MKRSILAFALSLALPVVALAVNSPFDRLAGQWSGAGTIQMSDGNSEALRCRASYDVLSEGAGVQLAIRCAGQSYSFDLRSSAQHEGGKITGVWNESTLNTGGQLSGSAKGDSIRIMANGQAFSAALTLVTNGNKQSVTIKSQQPNSKVVGATMTLSRSG
jgi:hypothetical protein